MRVLLLDVGNSRLKWGVGENGRIVQTGHIAQERMREHGIAALAVRLPRKIDAAVASNVAGASFGTRLAGVIRGQLGLDVHFVTTAKSACGVTNGYTQPRRLGVDRWMAIIGAWAELHGACLVVDAGTAVTIDALDRHGAHLGGQIFPGTSLMLAALTRNTAQIPAAAPAAKSDAFDGMDMFARSTRAAVQSGALGAIAGAVERAIRTLRTQARRAPVVLTGGDAARIAGALGPGVLQRPNLVLEGMLQVFESGAGRHT